MTRALVLGGGGPVGVGWQTGLIAGLHAAGVTLADSDAVIGTSAGSITGAQLLSGDELSDVVDPVSRPPGPGGGDVDLAGLITVVADALAGGGTDDDIRRRIGAAALDHWTVSEDAFVARFALLKDREWPDRYACTAVDAATGEFRLWDKASGVDLDRAVASSCAVPTMAAPITIMGARFMDGGVRNALNADLAVGHDVVVAISCMVLELPPGFNDPTLQGFVASLQSGLDQLRRGGARVASIAPGGEFLEISGWGLHLMDFSRVADAYHAGVRQGAVEADRIGAVWSD